MVKEGINYCYNGYKDIVRCSLLKNYSFREIIRVWFHKSFFKKGVLFIKKEITNVVSLVTKCYNIPKALLTNAPPLLLVGKLDNCCEISRSSFKNRFL